MQEQETPQEEEATGERRQSLKLIVTCPRPVQAHFKDHIRKGTCVTPRRTDGCCQQ